MAKKATVPVRKGSTTRRDAKSGRFLRKTDDHDDKYERNPDGTIKNHPLESVIGKMHGEDWEAILENIKKNREELDRLVFGDE